MEAICEVGRYRRGGVTIEAICNVGRYRRGGVTREHAMLETRYRRVEKRREEILYKICIETVMSGGGRSYTIARESCIMGIRGRE